MKIFLAALLLWGTNLSLSSTPKSSANSQHYAFTSHELVAANNIAKVYELGQKGYVNATLAKKTLTSLRSNELFVDYLAWLRNIVQIYDAKDLKKTKLLCSEISSNLDFGKRNSLQASLIKDNLRTCLGQYLKKLQSNNVQDNQAHLQFVKKNLRIILGPEFEENLYTFLIKIKTDNSKWKDFSSVISRYVIDNNINPNSDLLKHLYVDAELTKHVQQMGLASGRLSKVLYRELSQQSEEVIRLADTNDEKLNSALENLLNFYAKNRIQLPRQSSYLKILGTGKSLTRRRLYGDAQKLFTFLININANDTDAMFELLWTWLDQRNNEKAYEHVIRQFSLNKNYKTLKDERLQFWVGYTLKKLGMGDSRKVFTNLVAKAPLSFYAIVSSKLIETEDSTSTEELYAKLTNVKRNISDSPSFPTRLNAGIKRVGLWGKLDFKPLLQLELDQLFHRVSELEENQKYLAIFHASQLLIEQQNYLESFKLSYRAINENIIRFDKNLLQTLFPRPYMKQVSSASKDFDPLIALSLIRQESAFNLKARSWVGARGLMQLMPATARMYRKRLHVNHLYRPEVNLSIGSEYLSMLLKKYDQNLVYALSAYNAGESRVKKWKQEYFRDSESILHTIENIPFTETRNYVKLIYRNLFFYKFLEKQAQPTELADSGNLNEIFDVSLGFNIREE